MMVDLSKYLTGGAAGRADSLSGLNPQFQSALAQMFEAAPGGLQIKSAYRSPALQAKLYQDALAKYGSPEAARKWVAPPGRSQHGHGNAVDLGYLSPEAKQWAHANAAQYGLSFPLSNEDWHVELAGARGGAHKHGGEAPAAPAASSAPTGVASMFAESPLQAQAMALMPGGSPAGPAMPGGTATEPAGMLLGNLASAFIQNTKDRQQQRQDEQAAEEIRRAALLGGGGGIASLYG